VLWIFGTLTPLPDSLDWNSDSVEWIVSQAKEVILPPKIGARSSNPFTVISVMSKFKKLNKNPSGKSLDEILPQELTNRLHLVIEKFGLRKKKILNLRPSKAAEELMEGVLAIVELTNDEKISKQLRKIAKKKKADITKTSVWVDIETGLKVLSEIPVEAEIECLATTLEAIDADLQASLERALAWVDGDAQQLKALNYPDLKESCFNKIFVSPEAVLALQQARQLWINSAVTALQNNQVTFAYLPVRELVHPDGLLQELYHLGYEINGR
jgi:uncharacterized protein YbaP (TraB family)